MGQTLGWPASRGNSPDVLEIVRHQASHKIDIPAVRRPRDVMIVYARLILEDLPRVAAIPIGDENRISGAGVEVDDFVAVGGPSRLHRIWQEWARCSPERRNQPYVDWP